MTSPHATAQAAVIQAAREFITAFDNAKRGAVLAEPMKGIKKALAALDAIPVPDPVPGVNKFNLGRKLHVIVSTADTWEDAAEKFLAVVTPRAAISRLPSAPKRTDDA